LFSSLVENQPPQGDHGDAMSAKPWFLAERIADPAGGRRQSISSQGLDQLQKGCRRPSAIDPTANMFEFWGLGRRGRYSLCRGDRPCRSWSAVGAGEIRALLVDGAADMGPASFSAARRIGEFPVRATCSGDWYITSISGRASRIGGAALYAPKNLHNWLPAYLQQIEMESTAVGRRATASGCDLPNAPVLLGTEPGNQRAACLPPACLHQGTPRIPADSSWFRAAGQSALGRESGPERQSRKCWFGHMALARPRR